MKMGATPISFSSFLSSSPCISFSSPSLSSPCISFSSPSLSPTPSLVALGKSSIYRGCVACSAIQESSTPTTTAETKAPAEAKPSAPKPDAKAPAEAKPARPKPPAKAPTKPLPELMLEDVIPSLKTILEAQDVLSQINLTFQDNKLEGSFIKEGYPYSFWAFFPDGVLTGPKGFSLSSYGSGPSTVEPFLIDEKKITARHVVFWVEKRLAAQGIIPVWNE